MLDYQLAVPGAAALTFPGHLLKPLLAPLAPRAEPLPEPAKLALGGGLAGAALAASLVRRRKARS